MNGRICVVGPRDPLAGSGLGFDIGPIIDTVAQAGEKYLDYKGAQDAQKAQLQLAQLATLQQQQRQIALGTGGISGATIALLAVAGFFLLARRR